MGSAGSAGLAAAATRARDARRRRASAWLAGAAAAGLLAGALSAGAVSADEPEPSGGPPSLEALMAGMAGTSGVVARFREVKQLALLSEPLESRGTLTFVPPDRLARVTTEPGETRLVIDGDRFSFRDATGSEAIDLSANPIAREVVSNFIVLWSGDLEQLDRRYQPRFSSDAEGWRLELVPRDGRLREFVERVTLSGRGRAIERMEMIETGGDRTNTWFEDVETDVVFGEDELARIFSPSGSAAPR